MIYKGKSAAAKCPSHGELWLFIHSVTAAALENPHTLTLQKLRADGAGAASQDRDNELGSILASSKCRDRPLFSFPDPERSPRPESREHGLYRHSQRSGDLSRPSLIVQD